MLLAGDDPLFEAPQPSTAKHSQTPAATPGGVWFWIWLSVGICALAHVFGLVLGDFVGTAVWSHEPLHIFMDTVGACAGLMVAVMLLIMHQLGRGTNFNVPLAAGLFSMSVLDGLLTVVHTNESYVWLHSTATMAGGLLFALVYLPQQGVMLRARTAWILTGFVLLNGLATFVIPARLPNMVINGAFTSTAVLLNLGGGLLMLAAAVRLTQSYTKLHNRDDLIFAVFCLLFGGAAVFFEQSQLWDFSWWWWHGMRFAAYAVAFSFAICSLRTLQKEIQQLLVEMHVTRGDAEKRKRDWELELLSLRAALDEHPLFSVADPRGKILDANEGFCHISGYQREELLGQDHRILNSGHHPKAFWREMWKTVASGRTWRRDVCNRAKDGSLYWVDSINIPQLDRDGKILRYISLRFDITDKKHSEEQLVEARQQAEQASRAKSEFLANMSHEIRTPMTAILGYADLLSGDSEFAQDPKQAGEAIRTIRANAHHLLTIINDILDVSKIEAGQMTVESITTKPVVMLEELVSLVAPRASGKGIAFEIVYDTPVPERIQTDPIRLRQILLNLAGNAIKFTDVGRVVVRASCDPQAEQISFRVEDTGIGMSPDQVAKIARFNAFHQADYSMTRKFGGSGLGLRISNALAEMLGGGIAIESREGVGSIFTAVIRTGSLAGIRMVEPRGTSTRGDQAFEPTETDAILSVDAEEPLAGCHILLAEDGPDNQRLIRHYLKKAGAQVTLCENGRIAVQAVRGFSDPELPDVILMDMQMPELDGYGATRELRALGYELPIIALTAHAMEGERQKCLDAGCDEYLTKPIDRKMLLRVCARAARHGSLSLTDRVESSPSWF